MLASILEGWRRGSRGPLPQISTLQLLNALVLIDREGPIGRRILAQTLQIKDGVARGLLERLSETKIVIVSGLGVRLSEHGRRSLHSLFRKLSIRKILPLYGSDLVFDHQAVGVHLARAFKQGMTGVAQRDEAIKAGAEGSISIAVLGGRLVIPPDNKNLVDLAPVENARLKGEFKLSNGDLIIIGFGKDPGFALAGALAAVLSVKKA